MSINQKLVALSILRFGGRTASCIGRMAAVLEILGHPNVAQALVDTGSRIDYADTEIARLSVDAPAWPYPEEYRPSPALAEMEDWRSKKEGEMQRLAEQVKKIADDLEAEIDAADPKAVALWQEGQIP